MKVKINSAKSAHGWKNKHLSPEWSRDEFIPQNPKTGEVGKGVMKESTTLITLKKLSEYYSILRRTQNSGWILRQNI